MTWFRVLILNDIEKRLMFILMSRSSVDMVDFVPAFGCSLVCSQVAETA